MKHDLLHVSLLIKEIQQESDLLLFYSAKWLSIKWGGMLSLYGNFLEEGQRAAYRDRHAANAKAIKRYEQSPEETAAQNRIDEIEREFKRWRFLRSEIGGIFVDIKSDVLDGMGELVEDDSK